MVVGDNALTVRHKPLVLFPETSCRESLKSAIVVLSCHLIATDATKSTCMKMADGEVPQPVPQADDAASKGIHFAPPPIVEEATSNHSQHDDVEEVVTEEEYRMLPSPQFHQIREYDRLFYFDIFGNGFRAGLAGRRGCARTEVENRKYTELRFNFFTLVRVVLRRQVKNQFQTGQHNASNTLELMSRRYTVRYGTDLEIWIEDGKKYTSTRAIIDVVVNILSHGSLVEHSMKWVLEKDGKTNHRSTTVQVKPSGGLNSDDRSIDSGVPRGLGLGLEMGLEREERRDEPMDAPAEENNSDSPPSSFSQLIEGLKELLHHIRAPKTAPRRANQAIEPNLENSRVSTTAEGTSAGLTLLETSSRPANEETTATTETDLEAQPIQSNPPDAISKKTKEKRKKPKAPQHFVVIGIFSPLTGIPHERLVVISKPKHLFRDLWWGIMRLRGIEAFVSLKDVKGFAVYKCEPFTPSHSREKLNQSGKEYMAQLFQAYHSWTPEHKVVEAWMEWIDTALNHKSKDPKAGDMLSIELILGWSVFRISIAILIPVLLSLGIGLWLNSSDWADNGTIQTAWGVASYIATAGAFLGALLAVISGVSDK
ncbi:hypothetical protein HD806DRAFT_515017 [Xylariaceae sp. AK1471]|nr:hypothetical protein HD806DRAFT_515017 [Xylariaceae sp. AK1471]